MPSQAKDESLALWDDVGTEFWDKFFSDQVGGGGGAGGAFEGLDYQRGAGPFASFFKSLARLVMPTAKKVAKAVTKQAINTGTSVATDALAGRDVKESLAEHGSQAALNLLQKADNALSKQTPRRRGKKRKKVNKSQRGSGMLGTFEQGQQDQLSQLTASELSQLLPAKRTKQDIFDKNY